MDDLVAYCKQRFEEVKTERAMFEHDWEDIARFIVPQQGGFNSGHVRGQQVRRYQLDSTGGWAAEQLSNFLHGALTNPASDWFGIDVYDYSLRRRDDVREYTSYLTNHVYSILNNPRKKFYDHSHELYQDVVPYGNGIMYLENRPGFGISFKSRALYQCYLDEDFDSNIDVYFRKFKMSLRQILQEFGPGILPDKLRNKSEKVTSEKFEILHCVFPKSDSTNPKLFKNSNMPYASIYLMMDHNVLLRESGYRRFPVCAPRWSKRADEIYGRGPGTKALAEVRMLQKLKEITLKGGQKIVDPPLQVPDSTFLAPLDLRPGAVNYYNPVLDGSAAKNIIDNARPDIGLELMQEEKQAILRAFYVDKLSSQKGQNVEQTRTEFLGEQNERLMLMAPQLSRLHTEYVGPIIEDIISTELYYGRVAPPPAVLQNQPMVVQYKSPLARAQKMQRLQHVTGAVNDLAPLAQAFPEIMDSINSDGLAQWVFMSHDTPPDVMRAEEEVQRIREQRQQQQQLQAMAETAKTGSEAVRNISSVNQGQRRAAG